MEPLTTEEVIKLIQKAPVNAQPTAAIVNTPNVPFYIVAPYWLQHQAVCILADIAMLDKYTFLELIHLPDIQLTINSELQSGENLRHKESLYDRENFSDFIMYRFPIPHDKIDYIKNLNDFFTDAIKKGELKYIEQRYNDFPEKLLDPVQVINIAIQAGITISQPILQSLQFRDKVDRMR